MVLDASLPRCEEAHGFLAHAPPDHFLQAHESAAADEQDVRSIHRREFLVRMLAAALRWNIGNGAFQDLEQRLLHAFARHVAGNGRVFVLPADLIDLVDIDDALLAPLDVAIGRLQQLEDDILYILAHVTGFGEGGGVHNGERHIQDARQGLGHQGLAGAGGADQQNIGLGKLDLGIAHPVHMDAFAVVVDGHRQFLLGSLLPDYVLIQVLLDFQRLRQLMRRPCGLIGVVVF